MTPTPTIVRPRAPRRGRAFLLLLGREVADLLDQPSARIVLLFASLGLVLVAALDGHHYQQTRVRHLAIQADYAAALAEASVDDVAGLRHPAAKPPWPLGFLAVGGQLARPDIEHLVLSAWQMPSLERAAGDQPLAMRRSADWAFLLGAGLSLAAIMLGYDVMCGRRQRLKTRLALSYAVGRREFLAAQFAARWLTLFTALLLGTLVAVGFFLASGRLFDGATAVRLVQAIVVRGLLIALFLGLAFVVSMSARDAKRALGFLAFLWLLCVGVAPTTAELWARLEHPVNDQATFERALAAIRRATEAEQGGAGSWRPRSWAAEDGYAAERRAAAIQNRRFDRQRGTRRIHILDQLHQAELARRWALWSPTVLVQEIVERLAGSSLARDRQFLDQAWAFRSQLADAVARQDARDPDSPNILFFPGYLSTRPVAALPRFEFCEIGVAEGMRAAALPLLILVAELVAVLAFASARYRRWEVT